MGLPLQKQRAAKRIVKREKREAAQREALKASEVGALGSPRKLQSRLRHQSLDHPAPLPLNAAPLPEVCALFCRLASPTDTTMGFFSGHALAFW